MQIRSLRRTLESRNRNSSDLPTLTRQYLDLLKANFDENKDFLSKETYTDFQKFYSEVQALIKEQTSISTDPQKNNNNASTWNYIKNLILKSSFNFTDDDFKAISSREAMKALRLEEERIKKEKTAKKQQLINEEKENLALIKDSLARNGLLATLDQLRKDIGFDS